MSELENQAAAENAVNQEVVENATNRVKKKEITISKVLSLLEEGKSRKEIAEYFGETMVAMNKRVWCNAKLKNRKAKKQYDHVELIDDTEEVASVAPSTDLVQEDVLGIAVNQEEPVADSYEDVQQEEVQTESPAAYMAPATATNPTSTESW